MKFEAKNRHLLYGLLLFNILPFAGVAPWWILLAALTFVAWRVAADHTRVPAPGPALRSLLVVAFAMGVVNHFGTLIGDEASGSLLLVMAALKLFEMRSYRDIMILTYLCYFLLMSRLIASQGIAMTVFMFVDVVLITSLLALHHSPADRGRPRALVRRSLSLAAQGLPVVLLLFVLFPRFSAGIFPRDRENVGLTGFSDQIRPGSVAQLIQTDEIAFRVTFDQSIPATPQLYWRGAVLGKTTGLQWQPYQGDSFTPMRDESVSREQVGYEIVLEPTQQNWLFALDWPSYVYFPSDHRRLRVRQGEALTYKSRLELVGRELYRGVSWVSSRHVKWGANEDLEPYLDTSAIEAPRTKELAEQWAAEESSDVNVVNRAMDLYKENFSYTLNPPAIDNVDDFLFSTQSGFCEHFAASMATLLRFAGIPSRVIVGFHGGAPSLLEDYLIVRYLDAHAWIEYFDRQQGTWLRVDPTSAVAPMRLSLGGGRFNEIYFANQDQGLMSGTVGRWLGSSLSRWVLRAQLLWDQAEASWINFLLRYDDSQQRQLLSHLFGWTQLSRGFLLFVSAMMVVLVLGLISLWLARLQGRKRGDPSLALYRQLQQKLARQGLVKQPQEGPLEFCRRAEARFPSRANELKDLMDRLVRWRYGEETPTGEELKLFKQRMRRLRLS